MKNNRFWNWVRNEETGASEMYLYGAIAESTWFENDITPAMFRSELQKHSGDVTVFINSPGGDVFAASQIYTMLRNHPGKVTVKIDGIAASAASVVAMAGEETLISPTGMLMPQSDDLCHGQQGRYGESHRTSGRSQGIHYQCLCRKIASQPQ